MVQPPPLARLRVYCSPASAVFAASSVEESRVRLKTRSSSDGQGARTIRKSPALPPTWNAAICGCSLGTLMANRSTTRDGGVDDSAACCHASSEWSVYANAIDRHSNAVIGGN
jgi:hypothetical protein